MELTSVYEKFAWTIELETWVVFSSLISIQDVLRPWEGESVYKEPLISTSFSCNSERKNPGTPCLESPGWQSSPQFQFTHPRHHVKLCPNRVNVVDLWRLTPVGRHGAAIKVTRHGCSVFKP